LRVHFDVHGGDRRTIEDELSGDVAGVTDSPVRDNAGEFFNNTVADE